VISAFLFIEFCSKWKEKNKAGQVFDRITGLTTGFFKAFIRLYPVILSKEIFGSVFWIMTKVVAISDLIR
jgi:hypothetical protein